MAAISVKSFVAAFVENNGRGCPKGEILYVGKYSAKEIALAIENGEIEGGRGSQGGFFPSGQKPVPQAKVNDSLKARMAEFLSAMAVSERLTMAEAATAGALYNEYKEELARRAESQKS